MSERIVSVPTWRTRALRDFGGAELYGPANCRAIIREDNGGLGGCLPEANANFAAKGDLRFARTAWGIGAGSPNALHVDTRVGTLNRRFGVGCRGAFDLLITGALGHTPTSNHR
jgi:hypothetical protein